MERLGDTHSIGVEGPTLLLHECLGVGAQLRRIFALGEARLDRVRRHAHLG